MRCERSVNYTKSQFLDYFKMNTEKIVSKDCSKNGQGESKDYNIKDSEHWNNFRVSSQGSLIIECARLFRCCCDILVFIQWPG